MHACANRRRRAYRKSHYLRPGDDLILDWRPLWNKVRPWIPLSEVAAHQSNRRRPVKQLLELCNHACSYFDPSQRRDMLKEFLPFFSLNDLPNAYIVTGLLNTLLPSQPAPPDEALCQPADFLPTIFHLWFILNLSEVYDGLVMDLLSRVAREHLSCTHVPFGPHGIFAKEQSDLVFTAILRLIGIPVGQANSPYSSLDYLSGAGIYLEKDKKKHPIGYMMSRWILHSLSPACMESEDSIMASLEGLMESTETFFHPSNQGNWATLLAQLTLYLTDGFVSRWNREKSGELDVPEERKLTPALKKRFVSALKDATFSP